MTRKIPRVYLLKVSLNRSTDGDSLGMYSVSHTEKDEFPAFRVEFQRTYFPNELSTTLSVLSGPLYNRSPYRSNFVN